MPRSGSTSVERRERVGLTPLLAAIFRWVRSRAGLGETRLRSLGSCCYPINGRRRLTSAWSSARRSDTEELEVCSSQAISLGE
jgi:hypothetical protein